MNEGARVATGDVLYFLHADVQPPTGFDDCIKQRLKEGYGAGCFRLSFDSNHPLLLFYGWCTRFNINMFRFGDQSLFVKPEIFWQLDGYRDDFFLLEDQDIVVRLKTKTDFALCRQKVMASPRKYAKHGPAKLQVIYSFIVFLYKMGLAQRRLHRLYQKWVKSH